MHFDEILPLVKSVQSSADFIRHSSKLNLGQCQTFCINRKYPSEKISINRKYPSKIAFKNEEVKKLVLYPVLEVRKKR